MYVFLSTGCRFAGSPSGVQVNGGILESEPGYDAAESRADLAPSEDGVHEAGDAATPSDADGQPRRRSVTQEQPAEPQVKPELVDGSPKQKSFQPPKPDPPPQGGAGTKPTAPDDRRPAMPALAPSGLPANTFAVAVVPATLELGSGVLRRRMDAAARLGAALILLPPNIRLGEDKQFVFDDIAADFGPADVETPVVLWPEPNPTDEPGWDVLVDNDAGTILLLDSRAAGYDADVPRSLNRLLRSRENGRRDLFLVTDRPLWRSSPELWTELTSRLAGSERTVVLAFSRMGEVSETMRDGIRCIVVPHFVMRDEAGDTVWFSQGRDGPSVSLLRSDAVSDIQRINLQIREERDRLVQSLTVTPVCGPRSETTVRFQNTLDIPLDVRADWNFGNEEVPVKPEILGFQLAPGEEFSQVFRFQNDDESPLKFFRPRFVLSMSTPDGAGGESPLVVQAAPVCCMRGVAELVDDEIVLDGDPSEWAGRGYSLNHESQVVEGLDAWQGPADLSANLFVSRTADAVLIGARIYDDQHSDSDLDSQAELAIAVDLLPDQNLDPATGVSPASSEPTSRENGAGRDDEQGQVMLRFSKQGGIRIVPELEGVQARWSETAETISVEARIPVELFAEGTPEPRLRLDAALSQASDDGPPVRLVFSGRDPELENPDLFGIFRVPTPEENNE